MTLLLPISALFAAILSDAVSGKRPIEFQYGDFSTDGIPWSTRNEPYVGKFVEEILGDIEVPKDYISIKEWVFYEQGQWFARHQVICTHSESYIATYSAVDTGQPGMEGLELELLERVELN